MSKRRKQKDAKKKEEDMVFQTPADLTQEALSSIEWTLMKFGDSIERTLKEFNPCFVVKCHRCSSRAMVYGYYDTGLVVLLCTKCLSHEVFTPYSAHNCEKCIEADNDTK